MVWGGDAYLFRYRSLPSRPAAGPLLYCVCSLSGPWERELVGGLGDTAHIVSAKQKTLLSASVFSPGDQWGLVIFRSKCLLHRGAVREATGQPKLWLAMNAGRDLVVYAPITCDRLWDWPSPLPQWGSESLSCCLHKVIVQLQKECTCKYLENYWVHCTCVKNNWWYTVRSLANSDLCKRGASIFSQRQTSLGGRNQLAAPAWPRL